MLGRRTRREALLKFLQVRFEGIRVTHRLLSLAEISYYVLRVCEELQAFRCVRRTANTLLGDVLQLKNVGHFFYERMCFLACLSTKPKRIDSIAVENKGNPYLYLLSNPRSRDNSLSPRIDGRTHDSVS